jgi:5-methylcytosine-specific restriction endonuclease McrA
VKKKRAKLSNTFWGKLFQEAGNHCAFCSEIEPSILQVHHIDGNPSNNDFTNLILACASCHAKITARIVSEADVRLKKNQLCKKTSGAFSAEDIKAMRPSSDYKDPNDPIDWNNYFLKPEDF